MAVQIYSRDGSRSSRNRCVDDGGGRAGKGDDRPVVIAVGFAPKEQNARDRCDGACDFVDDGAVATFTEIGDALEDRRVGVGHAESFAYWRSAAQSAAGWGFGDR